MIGYSLHNYNMWRVIQFECQVVIQYELSHVMYGTYNHFVVNCRHVMNEGTLHLSTGKGECIHS